jgi:hypothetical protein
MGRSDDVLPGRAPGRRPGVHVRHSHQRGHRQHQLVPEAACVAAGTATFILGGQITGFPADILLVYPERNYIRASDDRPFLQIGESKYGKFMLEVAVQAHADLAIATKIALGSMMSTARANLSVGPPYDLAIYRTNSLEVDEFRITEDSVLLHRLQGLWIKHIWAPSPNCPVWPTSRSSPPGRRSIDHFRGGSRARQSGPYRGCRALVTPLRRYPRWTGPGRWPPPRWP